MQRFVRFIRILLISLTACSSVVLMGVPAYAAPVDTYVLRYLDVPEPVSLAFNEQGDTKLFSAEELSKGKRLFEESCKNCHVGGATLPDPLVSLSLDALRKATPPRNNISALVSYLRQPMTYDGSSETFWCRQIPESWMAEIEVENLSAFILRAAQKAPGWGGKDF